MASTDRILKQNRSIFISQRQHQKEELAKRIYDRICSSIHSIKVNIDPIFVKNTHYTLEVNY